MSTDDLSRSGFVTCEAEKASSPQWAGSRRGGSGVGEGVGSQWGRVDTAMILLGRISFINSGFVVSSGSIDLEL